MHAASCGHSLVSIEFNQSLAFYVFHTFSIIFIRYNTPKTFSSFGRVVSVNKQTSQTSRASHRRAGTGYGAAAARGTGPIVFCPTISNYCFFMFLSPAGLNLLYGKTPTNRGFKKIFSGEKPSFRNCSVRPGVFS